MNPIIDIRKMVTAVDLAHNTFSKIILFLV